MVVCVNNLGALSVLEMAVLTRAAITCLGNYGLSHFTQLDLKQKVHKLQFNFPLFTIVPLTCVRVDIWPLESRGIEVSRVMCGSFMTSLEMAGVSLSLMRAEQKTLRLFGEYLQMHNW